MKNSLQLYVKVLVISLLIGESFYLGMSLYSTRAVDMPEIIETKNFSAIIFEAIGSDFILSTGEKSETIPRTVLATWTEKYVRNYTNKEDLRLLPEKIELALAPIAASTKTAPVSARLSFGNQQIKSASPPVLGKNLNIKETTAAIIGALNRGESTASAVFDLTQPAVTLEKVNELGIKTLLGVGESDFSGSPTSRIHNIKVSAEKFNGVIVGPGEEFSFNSLLGEVDGENGYRPELVIKSGKLEYEFGGGVCQVSTTMFRAAINSGLAITERRPHSFPVRYYNPQGFDSTVYPGVVDLKFTNDTPGHILIQGQVVGNKINFEIYGTNDGRKVAVDGPVQYDINPDGSMKAYFSRTITIANGEKKTETFRSNYKAPAKYEANPLE